MTAGGAGPVAIGGSALVVEVIGGGDARVVGAMNQYQAGISRFGGSLLGSDGAVVLVGGGSAETVDRICGFGFGLGEARTPPRAEMETKRNEIDSFIAGGLSLVRATNREFESRGRQSFYTH